MEKPSVIHSTFVIERHYSQPPERVFAAFSDAAYKRRWFVEGEGHEVDEFALDFRVGGAERIRFRLGPDSPFPGVELRNEGWIQDVVPNRRLVTASRMELGGRRISASLVTIELLAARSGTDLICTHQGAFFEGADGPERREEGWRKLLERLAAETGAYTEAEPAQR